MKLAILSDFHLGYERFAEDAVQQALRAMALALEKADAILIAGDLFDTKIPKPETLAEGLSLFRLPLQKSWTTKITSFTSRDSRQQNCPVPVLAIPGTHEMRAKGLINPVQMFDHGGFLINIHAATAVLEKDGERVAVQGMAGVPDKWARETLEALDPKPIQGAFNIFMFHQSTQELIPPLGEEILSFEDLPPGFDLYVNGHIHSKFETKVHGKPFLIPGSTVITQLKPHETESKGFILFDTKTGKHEFITINSRPFHFAELQFENASLQQVYEKCRNEITSKLNSNSEKSIIRIKLSGTLSKGLTASAIDLSPLEREFSQKAHIFFDKRIETGNLKEKIAQLRDLRAQKISVRELGLELLQERLRAMGSKLDALHLFDLLSNPKRSAAEETIRKMLQEA